jgi:hypothetical protein
MRVLNLSALPLSHLSHRICSPKTTSQAPQQWRYVEADWTSTAGPVALEALGLLQIQCDFTIF